MRLKTTTLALLLCSSTALLGASSAKTSDPRATRLAAGAAAARIDATAEGAARDALSQAPSAKQKRAIANEASEVAPALPAPAALPASPKQPAAPRAITAPAAAPAASAPARAGAAPEAAVLRVEDRSKAVEGALERRKAGEGVVVELPGAARRPATGRPDLKIPGSPAFGDLIVNRPGVGDRTPGGRDVSPVDPGKTPIDRDVVIDVPIELPIDLVADMPEDDGSGGDGVSDAVAEDGGIDLDQCDIPPAPQLTSPVNGETWRTASVYPAFYWSDDPCATKWTLCLKDAAAAGVVCHDSYEKIDYEPGEDNSSIDFYHDYYHLKNDVNAPEGYLGKQVEWKVMACNANGCSDYSSSRIVKITLDPARPIAPTDSPNAAIGSPAISAEPDFSWEPVPGATSYNLRTYQNSPGGWWHSFTGISETQYTAAIFEPVATTVYWCVEACNAAGCSSCNYHSEDAFLQGRFTLAAPQDEATTIQSFSIDPATLTSGESASGNLVLDGTLPLGGRVQWQQNWPAVPGIGNGTTAATVEIPAGGHQVSWSIPTQIGASGTASFHVSVVKYTNGNGALAPIGPNNEANADLTVVEGLPPETFTDYLALKFSNPKCTNCHGVANKNAVYDAHMANGDNRRWQGLDPLADQTTIEDYIGTVANCSGCHPAGTWAANWHAPEADFDFLAGDACEITKNHMPTGPAINAHLHTDTLVLWAIGQMGESQDDWFAHVDAWTGDANLPCN